MISNSSSDWESPWVVRFLPLNSSPGPKMPRACKNSRRERSQIQRGRWQGFLKTNVSSSQSTQELQQENTNQTFPQTYHNETAKHKNTTTERHQMYRAMKSRLMGDFLRGDEDHPSKKNRNGFKTGKKDMDLFCSLTQVKVEKTGKFGK